MNQDKLPPPPKKKVEEKVKEKITQDDLVQPYEAGAPLMVTIVSASGLAKADRFGKSDPMCVLEFMGQEIGSTDVCDNTMDPVWYPNKKHTFKIRLPSKQKLPILKIKVFDSDAPALMSKVVSASKTGGEVGRASEAGGIYPQLTFLSYP